MGSALGSVFETIVGGLAIGCGIVAATVWWYVAERQQRDRGQHTGSFAMIGGGISAAAALGTPGVQVGAIFGLITLVFSAIGWAIDVGETNGSDLGGPTD